MDKISNFPIGEYFADPLFVITSDEHRIEWINNAAEVWLRRPFSTVQGQLISEIGFGFSEVDAQLKKNPEASQSYRGFDLQVNVRRTDFICRYQIFNCLAGIAIHFDPKEVGAWSPVSRGPDQSVTMLGKMLAHELKNPLAGIRGAAQLLESVLSSSDDLELTALIKSEVDRIGRLAERMEGFGQADYQDFSSFNVHEILRKSILIFRNSANKDIDFVEDFDPSLPEVLGDVDGMTQVIVNLMANAAESISGAGQKGTIELKTGYRAGIRKRTNTGAKRSLPVQVQIIDDGPGIPEHLHGRIFQPFVTGKANGQGLGLALISKIVDDHGGLIEVNSQPGRTVFTVLLPVHSDQNEETMT